MSGGPSTITVHRWIQAKNELDHRTVCPEGVRAMRHIAEWIDNQHNSRRLQSGIRLRTPSEAHTAYLNLSVGGLNVWVPDTRSDRRIRS